MSPSLVTTSTDDVMVTLLPDVPSLDPINVGVAPAR